MPVINPFARAVETLQPGATGAAMSELLDRRVTKHCALNWKAGRAPAPHWALQLLAAKIRAQADLRQAIAEEIERTPMSPGRKAGTRNIMAWNARR